MTPSSSIQAGTNFSKETLIHYISSIEHDIRVFSPQTFRFQTPILRYSNAGKAFFLYQLMLSAVTMWPEAFPGALTKIRGAIEGRLVLEALRKPIGQHLTLDEYFATIGEMASGNMAMREEIRLYMDQLFQRLLGFLVPFFINTPSRLADTTYFSTCGLTDWSKGCAETNWIVPKIGKYIEQYPLQASTLPAVSSDIQIICATRTSQKMQALETLGDRAVDFLFELCLLSEVILIPGNLRPRVKSIFLSNKMFSVLGPALRMNWEDALPPLKDPPDHRKIKVIADIFEARIGAIIQQDNGPLELEEWWCQNMPRVIQHTACLLYNMTLAPRKIEKRKRDEDSDRDGGVEKRMRYSTDASSSSQRPPTDDQRRHRMYENKENHLQKPRKQQRRRRH